MRIEIVKGENSFMDNLRFLHYANMFSNENSDFRIVDYSVNESNDIKYGRNRIIVECGARSMVDFMKFLAIKYSRYVLKILQYNKKVKLEQFQKKPRDFGIHVKNLS